jgi:hypothetical protein
MNSTCRCAPSPVVVEQELGQRLGQFGLADAGRAEEQERAQRAGSGPAGRRARGAPRSARRSTACRCPITRLPSSSSMRSSFSRSPSSILAMWAPGPAFDHLGDLLGAHGLFDHRRACPGLFGLGQLLLQLRDDAVGKLARLGQIALALGLIQFGPRAVELFLDVARLARACRARPASAPSSRPIAAAGRTVPSPASPAGPSRPHRLPSSAPRPRSASAGSGGRARRVPRAC